MLKLTKYEFRKNMAVPIIILIAIGVFELLFLIGIVMDNASDVASAFSLQTMIMAFSFLIIWVLSISTYSRELNSKSSYMTFMAPISTYKIIASKLLLALFMGLAFAVLMFTLFSLNTTIIFAKYSELESMIELVELYFNNNGYTLGEVMAQIAMIIIEILIFFYLFVVVAYLTITLSSTVLQNNKFKGLFSIVLFVIVYGILLFVALSFEIEMEITSFADSFVAALPCMLFSLVCIVASFFATGKLLEKKVSL